MEDRSKHFMHSVAYFLQQIVFRAFHIVTKQQTHKQTIALGAPLLY